jgi:uncharacterized cysteine cluster protein YcgN (CxxCxxCC family)
MATKSKPQNQCDGCTLCCKVPYVSELKKPVNTLCVHCQLNVGCKIYKARPQSCRDYTCLYITDNLSKDLKPNECHVVFEKLKNAPVFLALIDPDFPDSLDNPVVTNQIFKLLREHFSIVTTVGQGSTKNIILAEDTTKEEVWRHITIAYKLINF